MRVLLAARGVRHRPGLERQDHSYVTGNFLETLMRHFLAVVALAVGVAEGAKVASLVPTASFPLALAARRFAARQAAVPVATVTR